MDIQWEEPPAYAAIVGSGKQPGRYLHFALALRERPGKWAVLPSDGQERTVKGANATAQNIRRGKVKGFTPAGAYETAVHETKIWVRFKEDQEAEKKDEAKSELPKQKAESSEPSVGEVRAWAKKQGIDVPDRGMISRELFDRYDEALQRGEHGLGMRVVRD